MDKFFLLLLFVFNLGNNFTLKRFVFLKLLLIHEIPASEFLLIPVRIAEFVEHFQFFPLLSPIERGLEVEKIN